MKKNNELAELFNKHGSNKFEHGYSDIYFLYLEKLKTKNINLLEIGVADGKSLLAWSNYFKNGKIIGIDKKHIDLNEKNINQSNIIIHQGLQGNSKFIQSLIEKYEKFDIIIDDGSHFPKDVIMSFNLLFSSLKENGLYFVEDMQTSYIHFFKGNPFNLKYANTHMNFFKNLTDSLNYQEIANPFYKKKIYDSKITNISFYHNIIVVQKGTNDGHILELARYFRDTSVILRFIEYMDVGNLNKWNSNEVVLTSDIVNLIDQEMPLEPLTSNYGGEVAARYRYKDGSGEIGMISSISQPFCGDCTRARISTDGKLITCLFATNGTDLRALLRNGCTDQEVENAIANVWTKRTDRYSEERAYDTKKFDSGKKIEMYQIGG